MNILNNLINPENLVKQYSYLNINQFNIMLLIKHIIRNSYIPFHFKNYLDYHNNVLKFFHLVI